MNTMRSADERVGCLQDPERLWADRICLASVSKNLEGELQLIDRDRQQCGDRCVTLKTDHLLRVRVQSHEPCDSEAGRRLDGELVVRRLVHALADGSGAARGLHSGDFRWRGDDVVVEGTMSGITNAGTHRAPVFDPCQECHAPGYLEGRLCGRVIRSRVEELVGCSVTAAYRVLFDASESFQSTAVRGTLEGLVVCRCEPGGERQCVELSGVAEGQYPNPWSIGGHTIEVRDHRGTPTATANVVTWGGHTGLNVSYDTTIELGATAQSRVEVTLVHFSQPATAAGYDEGGNLLDSGTMVGNGPETIVLDGAVKTVQISAPNDETLLLRLCVS